MSKVSIALAADNKQAMGLAVSARSAAENCESPLDIYILDAGISESNRQKIGDSLTDTAATVIWFDKLAEKVSNLPNPSFQISRAGYSRLFLPDLLPDLDRILYLDCDTMARRDIGDLFNIDMEGALAMGVPDVQSPTVPFGVPRWFESGRSAGDLNYNSGVLPMDLKRWREEGATNRMLAFLTDGRHVRTQDQEAINTIIGPQINNMDPRWNQQAEIFWKGGHYDLFLPYSAETMETLKSDPWIVHFCNASKPWHFGYQHPYVSEWFGYLDRTAYAGWRPPSKTLKRRLAAGARSVLRLGRKILEPNSVRPMD